MLTTLLKQFGLGKAVAEPAFHQRQINLSGNRITFAMPENFSHDFPAEDMIESVDLDNAAGISDYHGVTLLRRFWDFKTDGFFKKDIGTLVMVLSVKSVPDGCKKNLAHPLEFVEVLQEALQKRHEELNKSTQANLQFAYSQLLNEFREFFFNSSRWLRYVQIRDDAKEISVSYALPVTQSFYIVADFISLPSDIIHIRSFTDNYTDSFSINIMKTFDVIFSSDSHFDKEVAKLERIKLEKLIKELPPAEKLAEYRAE